MAVYFVTICAHDRQCIFGHVDRGEVVLSDVGVVARDDWMRTFELRPYVEPDAFVVTPNHVHLLFGLWTGDDADLPPWPAGKDDVRFTDTARPVPTRPGAPAPMSVPAIVGAYKSAVTRAARRAGHRGQAPLWQGRYHDRVVRNERERNAIRDYIAANPDRWHTDCVRHGQGTPCPYAARGAAPTPGHGTPSPYTTSSSSSAG